MDGIQRAVVLRTKLMPILLNFICPFQKSGQFFPRCPNITMVTRRTTVVSAQESTQTARTARLVRIEPSYRLRLLASARRFLLAF